MPVSKKPRRKKSNVQSSNDTSTVVTLPDRRSMEGFMSAIGGRQSNNATAKAQEVMYEAWDQTDRRARVALAHKALRISPLCADAYVLLAEEEAKSTEEALEYYRKGVEVGEQALGAKGFREYAGHFWGFLETRPYMRAREGLAATLNALGEVDADELGILPGGVALGRAKEHRDRRTRPVYRAGGCDCASRRDSRCWRGACAL